MAESFALIRISKASPYFSRQPIGTSDTEESVTVVEGARRLGCAAN
jgi:hypothetical protein